MFDASPEDIMPPSMDAAPPDDRPSSRACASFEHFVYPTTFAPLKAKAAPTTISHCNLSEMTAVTSKTPRPPPARRTPTKTGSLVQWSDVRLVLGRLEDPLRRAVLLHIIPPPQSYEESLDTFLTVQKSKARRVYIRRRPARSWT